MARTAKKGLEYLPLDVNIFSDIKIIKLRHKCDEDAPMIFIALLCEIYREGYYIKWDEDFAYVLAEKTHKSEDYINEVLNVCFEVELFDEEIFAQYRVLTSQGIQRQYNQIGEKSKRTGRVKEYSLLFSPEEKPSEEGAADINSEEMHSEDSNSGNYSEEMPIKSEISAYPPKECNKEKKRKVKESKEYSSFILPSYEEEIDEEKKEEEKIVQYNFFEKNWPAAREEYRKLVAYNTSPAAKKKWDDLTAQEKMSLAMLWHQEPQRPQRFDAGFLAMWRKVYVVLARDAPWAIRMAALDDKLYVTYSKPNCVLRLPAALQAFMEEHIDFFKPVIWPEIQRHECGRLVYVPY